MRYTHTVVLRGADNRTAPSAGLVCRCRLTRTMVILDAGAGESRYSRLTGFPVPRRQWPRWCLDLDSLVSIGEDTEADHD
jgi:hypothetical protein